MTSQWIANPSAYQDRPANQPPLDISIETFPPADELSRRSFRDNLARLNCLAPGFVSVTSGAGGSGNDATSETIKGLRNITRSPVAAHITGIDKSRSELQKAVEAHLADGVGHLVVLRGDESAESPAHPDGFRCARDMVAAIRGMSGTADLKISVAGYPEGHPDAESLESEIRYLKDKVDAGADQVITQFFFGTEQFLAFHDRAREAGISVPIVPGILPVENFDRAVKFAARCGTRIPDWYHVMYRDLDHNKPLHRAISVSITVEQCRQLMAFGIRSFHFYTLNRAELTLAICERLGVIRGKTAEDGEALRGAA